MLVCDGRLIEAGLVDVDRAPVDVKDRVSAAE